MQAHNKAVGDFFALPGQGRTATTTGPSIRNAIYNVKSLPGDFAKIGSKISTGFKTAVHNIKNPPAGGFRGRGGARSRALQMRMK